MALLICAIIIRIFSNSYLNVFQKLLTNRGEHSSIVNFYNYLGLSLLGYIACYGQIVFCINNLPDILIMGLLGALGNYFIIKALSCGELSTLAPINSYKPIIALIFGFILLKEIPSIYDIIGILLVILGTMFLIESKFLYTKAILYRFAALVFSGCEAIFIKKVIITSDISSAFFYWALAGFVFSMIFAFLSHHPLKISSRNLRYQILLVLSVAVMQYSTNFVFSKMNVAQSLALFQLSSIVSVFLGINIFKERGLVKKLFAAFLMLIGAVILIL